MSLKQKTGTDNMFLGAYSSFAILEKEEMTKILKSLTNYLYVAGTCGSVKVNILDKGCIDQIYLQINVFRIN